MKNYKQIIFLTILFLTIGFAAVTTTLVINVNSIIGTNQNDFYVYFSEAILDTEDVSDKVISEDKLNINYKTKDLSQIGDTSTLEYTVVNASKNYDAEVNVTCTGETEIASITQSPENQIVLAGTSSKGNVTVTLNKNVIEGQEIPFTCALNVSAVERTELGKEYRECEYAIGAAWNFDYKGAEQEFVVPCDGTYKIELWGAQGGGNSTSGYGGYVSGSININKNIPLFIYVGNKPLRTENSFNGGGSTNNSHYPSDDGGGATDIRLVSGAWNNFDSLKSRIMVAGAGGGSIYYRGEFNGGSGGGLIGYDGMYSRSSSYAFPTGGTQNTGGIRDTTTLVGLAYDGGFGYGGNGEINYGGGGGGSGYYGGGGGNNYQHVSSGAGGSSFISGHFGCDAISDSSTEGNIIHTGQANHYSGHIFTDTVMIDGNGYNWTTEKEEYVGMPTHDGTGTMTGNTGNGYAKITLVSID